MLNFIIEINLRENNATRFNLNYDETLHLNAYCIGLSTFWLNVRYTQDYIFVNDYRQNLHLTHYKSAFTFLSYIMRKFLLHVVFNENVYT